MTEQVTDNQTINLSSIIDNVATGYKLFCKLMSRLLEFLFWSFTAAVFLFCILMIVGIFGLAYDGVGVETYKKPVTVISTEYSGSSSIPQLMIVGKTTIISESRDPESWKAVVSDGTKTMTCETTEKIFNSLEKGSVVEATLYHGKYSKSTQCKSI